MTVFTVTKEGEVTLTSDVLKGLGIHPGDRITVVERPGGRLELSPVKEAVPTAGQETGGLEKFFGSLKNEHNIHATLEEIQEAIEAGWAGEVRFDDDR